MHGQQNLKAWPLFRISNKPYCWPSTAFQVTTTTCYFIFYSSLVDYVQLTRLK